MAESHVVSGLANKRAEIAGMIAWAQQQIGQFRADLAHLDATIRLFAPAMEPETIPAKRIRQTDLRFEPGGLSRRVVIIAGKPIRCQPGAWCECAMIPHLLSTAPQTGAYPAQTG